MWADGRTDRSYIKFIGVFLYLGMSLKSRPLTRHVNIVERDLTDVFGGGWGGGWGWSRERRRKFRKNYVEIKCQLDATEVFIADLIACPTCFGHHYAHHQELKSIIPVVAACGISCCGFQVAGLVWS